MFIRLLIARLAELDGRSPAVCLGVYTHPDTLAWKTPQTQREVFLFNFSIHKSDESSVRRFSLYSKTNNAIISRKR